MVSDAKIAAADVWESALADARCVLCLPPDLPMDIELVGPASLMPQSGEQGPDRHVWRRACAWELEEPARTLLTNVRRIPSAEH